MPQANALTSRSQLERIGVKLAQLIKKQAAYLGVSVEGPYKPENYRYGAKSNLKGEGRTEKSVRLLLSTQSRQDEEALRFM